MYTDSCYDEDEPYVGSHSFLTRLILIVKFQILKYNIYLKLKKKETKNSIFLTEISVFLRFCPFIQRFVFFFLNSVKPSIIRWHSLKYQIKLTLI